MEEGTVKVEILGSVIFSVNGKIHRSKKKFSYIFYLCHVWSWIDIVRRSVHPVYTINVVAVVVAEELIYKGRSIRETG